MTTRLTESLLQQSAERVLSKDAGGEVSPEIQQQDWERLKGSICKKLLASPDTLIYFSFLASNKITTKMSILHGVLCEIIVACKSSQIEEISNKDIKEDASIKINEESVLVEMSRLLEQRTSSADSSERLESSAQKALSIRMKQLIADGGVEKYKNAEAVLDALIGEATYLAFEISEITDKSTSCPDNLTRSLGEAALGSALPGALHAARARKDTLASVLDLANSVGLIRAYTRNVLISKRLSLTDFGDPLKVVKVPSEDSKIRIANKNSDLPVDFRKFSVSTGHIVKFSNRNSLLIEAIEDNGVLVLSGPVKRTELGQFRHILSPAQEDYLRYKDLASTADFTALYGALSTSTRVSRRNGPQLRNLARSARDLAEQIAPVTTEAARALRGLAVDVPERRNAYLLQAMNDYSPRIKESDERIGDDILDSLRAAGYDLVEQDLLSGSIAELTSFDHQECSHAGNVSSFMELVTAVNNYEQ